MVFVLPFTFQKEKDINGKEIKFISHSGHF